jgi:mRNA-degrading endonuclease RelE of RelBE toxin-antitoxin system
MLDVSVYRVHVGPYRISYDVDDKQRRVRVFLLEEAGEGE